MKPKHVKKDRQDSPTMPDETATCDICGAYDALAFGDRHLCQTCYEGCGSCCPEFGKDDLWTAHEKS